jgi:hypothetical protein
MSRANHFRSTKRMEPAMLCTELEHMEAQFDDILTALENPNLTEGEKRSLEEAYTRLSHAIQDHQKAGHGGRPCFEE